jgi:hypothetical protein
MRIAKFASIGPLLLSVALSSAHAQGTTDEGDPAVEYVRVCDAFGTGFFYIPGTETCLKINGRVRFEIVENPSDLGTGTVRRAGGGPESFNVRMPDEIERWGGGVGFEYGLGGGKVGVGTNYLDFIYGDFDYSAGSASESGSAVVGENDVTAVALTFGRPDLMLGTGVFTDTAGFGLEGSGEIDNDWGQLNFGYGRSFILGDEPGSPAIVVRGGLNFEGIRYDSTSGSILTSGGAPFDGYYQGYDLRTEDFYAGATIGVDLVVPVLNGLRLTLGGEVNFGHHWGDVDFYQWTGTGGGNEVVDELDAESSDFYVGGAVKVEAAYTFASNWDLSLGYTYSVLPKVTGVDMRASPSEPELQAVQKSIDRHFFTLRLGKSF